MDESVRQAIMKVSRVFQKLCSRVVNISEEGELLENASLALCFLEREFPIGFFVIMTHLMPHLVEELFLCGPVHCRWMYPMERYMKSLKDYVRTNARPEGSMAEGYRMEETLGFCTEYMTRYEGTSRRVWDKDEDQSMYDEIVEGGSVRRPMSKDVRGWAHFFVLENAAVIEPYRRYVRTPESVILPH